jgi:hypothetical protein
LEIRRRRKPGFLADGGNLYLNVENANSKSWIFRYARDGVTKDMGLGSLNAAGLADARDLASEYRKHLANGVDPLAARNAERQQNAAKAAKAMIFREAAETYMRANEPGWRNAKHRRSGQAP